MIVFLGDSFTWGQGLEWEYMINNEGSSTDDCNKLMPPNHSCERLPLHLQDYREKNRWPRLVAEHFNQQYDLSRCGNGGSNYDAYIFLQNLENFIHGENLDLVIFQLTNSHRGIPDDFEGDVDELFIEDVIEFKNCLEKIKEHHPHINFLTLSWLPEPAVLIEKILGPEMLVKFNFEGKEYNSFEEFIDKITLSNKHGGLIDHHFNLEGHQFIAKSVIEHIEKYDLFNQKQKLI
jgi:lysophospholipase L1-like esterase